MPEIFNLEIISPEKKLIEKKIQSITIPAFEGEMTILPDHIPLITFLRPGIIEVSGKNKIKYFIEEGTVEFSKNNLIILSSTIVDLNSISKDTINKYIDDCKTKLKKDDLSDKQRYIVSHKMDCLSKIN